MLWQRSARNWDSDGLLNLDGAVFDYSLGAPRYWVKIEAKVVDVTPERPHGLRYNLTLHDSNNARIVGSDNAHNVVVSKGAKGRKFQYDHKHIGAKDKGQPYSFKGSEQLLNDFWLAVDKAVSSYSKEWS